jgi:hypothetical protein
VGKKPARDAVFLPPGVVGDDATERFEPLRDRRPDAAEADDADALPAEPGADEGLEELVAAAAEEAVAGRDAAARALGEVDVVEARAHGDAVALLGAIQGPGLRSGD